MIFITSILANVLRSPAPSSPVSISGPERSLSHCQAMLRMTPPRNTVAGTSLGHAVLPSRTRQMASWTRFSGVGESQGHHVARNRVFIGARSYDHRPHSSALLIVQHT